MGWKDPFLTITFPNNVIFTIASLLQLIIHTGVIIEDLYHFFADQNLDRMSFNSTSMLLCSQVAGFYWALLASIYTLQSEDSLLLCFALTSLAMNFAIFIARFCLEYLIIEYREEIYWVQ